jgi:hypothetical protein
VSDDVYRSSRVLAAVGPDHRRDPDRLSSIVLQGRKVQRVPRSKSTPVFDPNGRLAAGFPQTSGNTVIDAAAAFNTWQDQDHSASLPFGGVQPAVKAGSPPPQWSQSESGD